MTLISSYGGAARYAAALELTHAGKILVREMITHRLGLAQERPPLSVIAMPPSHLSLHVPIYRHVPISCAA
jgi:threonine dehydrogenase-like Zn-dependent dehydrogenase